MTNPTHATATDPTAPVDGHDTDPAGRTAWDVLTRQLADDTAPALTWSRPGTILAVSSEKGGVGKSGLAGGLTAVMAAAGRDVLAIDLDPRGSLTAELGAETTGELGVNDLLYVDPAADPDTLPQLAGLAADAIRPAGEAWGPHVHVLAAERALGNRETDPAAGMEDRLRVALTGVADRYDLVVIDLPPRPGGRLIAAGLRAATAVVFPATLDEDGYVGLRDALRTFRITAQADPAPARVVGVVRNIVDGRRTSLAALYDDKIRADFGSAGVLDLAVPRRVLRQESRAARVPFTAAGDGPDVRDLRVGYSAVLTAVGAVG